MKPRAPFSIDEQQLIDYIQAQGRYILRREIARAFHVKADDKRLLKELLNKLESQNILKRRGKSYCSSIDRSLATAKVTGIDETGQITATLIDSEGSGILLSRTITAYNNAERNLNIDDRIIVTIVQDKQGITTWNYVRKLMAQPTLAFGLVKEMGSGKYVLQPIDRKVHDVYPLIFDNQALAQEDALIEAHLEKTPGGQMIARGVKILKDLENYIRKLSLIAAYKYDLPQQFSPGALLLAEKCQLPGLKGRIDLRDLPLVTIDDIDARDHDDAVYCEPIEGTLNWRLIVAIADVSYFVHIGDALDQDALARANSVYFPDQVIPMLPEQLSNNLCSLKPGVDRPCLVADMVITPQGHLDTFTFYTAMMRSWGKLTYVGVQNVLNGDLDALPKNIHLDTITHLNAVYQVLKAARSQRGTLDFDLPEKKVLLDDQGNIKSIMPRRRLESNQLIEEMMIMANVAAAQYLGAQPIPPLYRIHDEPRQERLEDLRRFLESTPVSLPRGQTMRPKNFMHILDKAKDLDQGPAIHELILRAQSQAQYSPDNIGHFGLNLPHYCHFTSPIRRYADLIVHRAIKAKIAKDAQLYPYSYEQLEGIGQEISDKERRAGKAERDTVERYVARFLQHRVGEPALVQVSGITTFAIFVSHIETGADGILPLRNLMGDYFTYLPDEQMVKGRRSGQAFRLGDQFEATLESTNWVTGSLIFSLEVNNDKKKLRKDLPQRNNIGKQLHKR